MSISLPAVFGVLSAAVAIVSFVPYIRDIIGGGTKPERATWWIWTSLGSIAFAAQAAAGATWSLLMTGGQTLGVIVIALLSIKYGYGRFSKRDKTALFIAVSGIVLWQLINIPLIAIVIVIGVDFTGTWLTLTKTWKAPNTETLITWVLAGVSGAFGFLAVGRLDMTELVYPFYITLANLAVVYVIFHRRKVLAHKKPGKPSVARSV